jgi:2-polyprenyl-6-methoxyphenol hydroxylase-like FAD-dependent oxidoreductase
VVNEARGHAVVCGAGMAGLFAARVLAESFQTVSLVERDRLPHGPAQRHGVPQGRHFHVLSIGGSRLLERFFPGVLDELAAGGAAVCDDTNLSRLLVKMGGHALNQSCELADPDALVWHFVSRPFLESYVRQRVRAIDNVTITDGHDVAGLVARQRNRVTGARLVDRDTGLETVVDADLVVDAMGRAARTPAFLDDLGYDRPVEHHALIRGSYSSQLLKIPAGTLAQQLTFIGPESKRQTGGTLSAYENDTWMLSVGCVDGREPPGDLAEIITVFEQFAPAEVVAAVRSGEPLGEVSVIRHRGVWRRYDKMGAFPEGLLVFGDAIASLNPIYGQGMTVALLEAAALRDCLSRPGAGLSKRFFKAAARQIRPVWTSNQNSDLYMSKTQGRPSALQRLINWQMNTTLTTAEHDRVLTEGIFRVGQFIDPPSALLRAFLVSTTQRVAAKLRMRRQPEKTPA